MSCVFCNVVVTPCPKISYVNGIPGENPALSSAKVREFSNVYRKISVTITDTGLLFRQKNKDNIEQHIGCFTVFIGCVLLEILDIMYPPR